MSNNQQTDKNQDLVNLTTAIINAFMNPSKKSITEIPVISSAKKKAEKLTKTLKKKDGKEKRVFASGKNTLSVADDMLQRGFGKKKILRILLDPGGDHGAVNQREDGLCLGNALLLIKTKTDQMPDVELLPVFIDLLAGLVDLLVKIDRFNGDHGKKQRGEMALFCYALGKVIGHTLKRGQCGVFNHDAGVDAFFHLMISVFQRLLNELKFTIREVIIEAALWNAAPFEELGQAEPVIAFFAEKLHCFKQNQFSFIHTLIIGEETTPVKKRGIQSEKGWFIRINCVDSCLFGPDNEKLPPEAGAG